MCLRTLRSLLLPPLAVLAVSSGACGDIEVRLGDDCQDDEQCAAGQLCISSVCTEGCSADDDCRRRGLGFYCREAECTDDGVERPLLLVLQVTSLGRFEEPGPTLAITLDELLWNVVLDASGSVYLGDGEVAWSWRVLENPDALDLPLTDAGGGRATVTTPRVFHDTAAALELAAEFPGGKRTLRLDLTIRDSENEPPDILVVGPNAPVPAGQLVALDASGTTDPNGDGLALPFAWQQREGPDVTLEDASEDGSWGLVRYVAPSVPTETRQVFEVTASDDRSPPATAEETVAVRIAGDGSLCESHADCDDADPCTTDTCDGGSGACGHEALAECCGADNDCDDAAPCTTDECDLVTGECAHGVIAGCCRSDADCDDADPCTDDTCAVATGECAYPAAAGCCRVDADCDDGDPCTADACDVTSGDCAREPVPDCCQAEADCVSGPASECTVDRCVAGTCEYDVPVNGATCGGGAGVCVGGSCCEPATCTSRGVACGVWEDGCGGSIDCGTCGDGATCNDAGACEPDTVTCNVPCPPLDGYSVACNEMDHCEYTFDGATGWRVRDVLIRVPPGPFPMGAPDAAPGAWQYPVHAVDIARGYWIDRYEVTAAAFAAFLDDRGSNTCADGVPCVSREVTERNVDWPVGAATAVIDADCQSEPNGPADQSCADHSVGGVTWYGASEFCRSIGKRLCTESEYERAAKGTSQRRYPWGEAEPGRTLANCRESVCADGYDTTSPVGAFPDGASPVGAQDLAGNAWEWVEDDWHDTFAVSPGHPTDGSAWIDEPRAALRVLRGGGWGHDAAGMRSTDRFYHAPPITSDFALGFRCCR